MNRQDQDGLIGWAEFSWNPIVGCNNGCFYCYARTAMERFGHIRGCRLCEEFTPHIHRERLSGKSSPEGRKTPAWIFADSVSDWWGPGVEPSWRSDALAAMRRAPQHNYVLLTKCPENIDWVQLNAAAPPNLWLGVSVTSGDDWWRVRELLRALERLPQVHGLVSFEPLLGPLGADPGFERIEWVIIGGASDVEGWELEPEAHEDALRIARYCGLGCDGAPVWEKSNLGEIGTGREYRRERPA